MTAIEEHNYTVNQVLTTTSGDAGGAIHYFGVGGDASLVHGVQFMWDATFAGSITIWTSSFRASDAPINSTTAGAWIQQNPTSGYTPISPGGAATAATPLVITIPGGTAGGCDLSFGNIPQKRFRAVVTVTTAGLLRAKHNGKE